MMKILPKQKSGILSRKIGQETMLYDTNREMVYIINATANMVWDCCDGETKREEIEQKLKNFYSFADEIDIQQDICEVISDFSQKDLLCTDL